MHFYDNADIEIKDALNDDLGRILELQYLSYQSEAELLGTSDIPPLKQTLSEVESEFHRGVILKAVDLSGTIIGSVRGAVKDGTLYVGKLIVHPKQQGQGIGSRLLEAIEKRCPHTRCELFTSSKSAKNIRLYQRIGYRVFREEKVSNLLSFIYLEK